MVFRGQVFQPNTPQVPSLAASANLVANSLAQATARENSKRRARTELLKTGLNQIGTGAREFFDDRRAAGATQKANERTDSLLAKDVDAQQSFLRNTGDGRASLLADTLDSVGTAAAAKDIFGKAIGQTGVNLDNIGKDISNDQSEFDLGLDLKFGEKERKTGLDKSLVDLQSSQIGLEKDQALKDSDIEAGKAKNKSTVFKAQKEEREQQLKQQFIQPIGDEGFAPTQNGRPMPGLPLTEDLIELRELYQSDDFDRKGFLKELRNSATTERQIIGLGDRIAKKLDSDSGAFGPVVRAVLAGDKNVSKLIKDKETADLVADMRQLKGLIPKFARDIQGQRGVLSDVDIRVAEDALFNPTNSNEVFTSQLNSLKEIVSESTARKASIAGVNAIFQESRKRVNAARGLPPDAAFVLDSSASNQAATPVGQSQTPVTSANDELSSIQEQLRSLGIGR